MRRRIMFRPAKGARARSGIKPERVLKKLIKAGCKKGKKCKRHYCYVELPTGESINLSLHPTDSTIKSIERIFYRKTGKRINLR